MSNMSSSNDAPLHGRPLRPDPVRARRSRTTTSGRCRKSRAARSARTGCGTSSRSSTGWHSVRLRSTTRSRACEEGPGVPGTSGPRTEAAEVRGGGRRRRGPIRDGDLRFSRRPQVEVVRDAVLRGCRRPGSVFDRLLEKYIRARVTTGPSPCWTLRPDTSPDQLGCDAHRQPLSGAHHAETVHLP